MAWNLQQLAQAPNVVGNSRLHCRSHTQAPVNAAKVVMREVERYGDFQMFEFAGERQRQARESCNRKPHAEVLPFYKTGRDVTRVRVSASDFGYNLRDSWWGVPRIRPVVLSVIAEQFGQLGKVRIAAKRRLDSFLVEDVRVSGQLNSVVGNSAAKIAHEGLSVFARTLANNKRRNQLRIRVERNIYPLIAKIGRVILSDVLSLLHQKSPQLIALNSTAGQLAHPFIHQLCSAFASLHKQSHDCVAIQAHKPFGAANGTTFQKALNGPCREIRLRDHCGACQLRMRFGESGLTGSAFPTLNFALTKASSANAVCVLASYASHIGLVFLAGQADNDFAVGIAACPACRLAPQPVSAGSGALFREWTRPDLDGHPATLEVGALPVELRAHKKGIYRLAPIDASRLILSWASYHHSRSPFA